MKHDLEERTTIFSKEIIRFCKIIQKNIITIPIISQMVRSGTSIGANYREANEASSKKDFKNKISISKKEANETKYWLELIQEASPENHDKAKSLWKEANELNLIFGMIFRKTIIV